MLRRLVFARSAPATGLVRGLVAGCRADATVVDAGFDGGSYSDLERTDATSDLTTDRHVTDDALAAPNRYRRRVPIGTTFYLATHR